MSCFIWQSLLVRGRSLKGLFGVVQFVCVCCSGILSAFSLRNRLAGETSWVRMCRRVCCVCWSGLFIISPSFLWRLKMINKLSMMPEHHTHIQADTVDSSGTLKPRPTHRTRSLSLLTDVRTCCVIQDIS